MIILCRNEKGFLSLIGMLLTLVITCYLFYILINSYFKSSISASRTANIGMGSGGEVSGGIDTSGYRSIVGSVKSTLNDAGQQEEKRIGDWANK